VRALPLDAAGGRRIGWLDALAIDARLRGRKKDLASEFVTWATSWAAYKIVLTPVAPDPPRYLLPARARPPGELKETPLYPAFEAAFQDRLFLTASQLNATLRDKARALNCALPAERDDAAWAAACGKPR
jgi:thiamine pyridinylase